MLFVHCCLLSLLCSSQFSKASPDDGLLCPGLDHVTLFFCWLDFLDHMMTEAPQVSFFCYYVFVTQDRLMLFDAIYCLKECAA